jgi:peptidoglycan/LPS O-acetylase OafA/YrhL
LQNDLGYGAFHIPVLLANTNLWSLNYEALYYLLFILIWSRSSGFVRPMIVACILTGLGIAIPGFPPLLANYATGWMFWLAGYGLSLTAKDKTSAARWPWPSLLLLGLATWKIKPFYVVANRLGWPVHTDGWVNATFVDFLPVCAALVMIVAVRRPKIAWLLVLTAAVIPAGFMVWRILRGRCFTDDLALYDGLVVLGLAGWWIRPSLRVFRLVAPLGAISYGIYVFQRPVQWCIARHDWLPSCSAGTFWMRAAIITGLTLLLAWLAEKKLQPVIKRFLTAHL